MCGGASDTAIPLQAREDRASSSTRRLARSKAAEAQYNARRLAALCGVTGRQLRRRFRLWTGKPVRPWLNEVQLWSSIPMLIDGRLIKDITSELGFGSAEWFCVRFQRRFGVCPSRFLHSRRAVRWGLEETRPAVGSDTDAPTCSLTRLQACVKEKLRVWERARWPSRTA